MISAALVHFFKRQQAAEDPEKLMKPIFYISIFILLITGCSKGVECSYSPSQSEANAYPELSRHENCGEFEGENGFHIYPDHRAELDYSYQGVAQVIAGGKVFYVNQSGSAIRTIFFDNGGDYFSDGLARTISKGKIGYFNENLEIIIAPEFDFAFPFVNGVAVVCNMCGADEAGEHKVVAGGKWGVIDMAGNILLPITSSKEALLNGPKFKHLLRR